MNTLRDITSQGDTNKYCSPKIMRIAHLSWDGPFSLGELGSLRNDTKDYGLYAVYGSHPSYGTDVILYLGKASAQTFGVRISQEDWMHHEDDNNIKLYVARLCGPQNCSLDEWSILIDDAERLMIHAHTPAYNCMNLLSVPYDRVRDIHIFNWGKRRSLLPEVSGGRWADIYDEIDEEEHFEIANGEQDAGDQLPARCGLKTE